MASVFLKLVNVSITASWIVLGILLLRLFLRKAPKWISVLLWSIVALRLLIPVHMESRLSLIPSPEVIPQDITTSQTPAINSGIPIVNNVVNPALEEHVSTAGGLETILSYAAIVWLIGVAVLVLYSLISTLRLRLQVRASLKLRDNIYVCDDVAFPFVLGVVAPRIYLPSGMKEEQIKHVLAHENAHLKRKDHWWKPLGYMLLTVYWFNPLMWLAYILLTRDIEQACDEKVIADMDVSGKKGYSEALAECSTQRRMIMICPVAFGEVSVKNRIKGVLNYKKPAFWLIIGAVVTCAVAAVCFLTDPFPCIHHYDSEVTLEATCTTKGKEHFTCTKCEHSYVKSMPVHNHTYDDGVVLTEPSCTAKGLKERTCTGCGKKIAEAVGLIPHTAGEVTVTKAPNCTEKGEGTTPCTVCGTVFTVSIATNDVHDLIETVVKAPICGEGGEGMITCSRCSYEQKCIYEPLKHHYEYNYIISEHAHQYVWIITCIHCGDNDIGTSWKEGNRQYGNQNSSGRNSSSGYGNAPNPGKIVNTIEWNNGFPIIIWDPNGYSG